MVTALLLLALGCAPAWHIDADTLRVQDEVARMDANKYAEACAPREVALARAHQDFARIEAEQGDSLRVRDHLDISLAMTAEALRLAAECAPGDADGDGVTDDVDKCLGQPEDIDGDRDDDGCPDVDSDGDGMEDDVDQCPDEPEDLDSFKDGDGCPEPDNDEDGVLDADDRCPVQAETVNDYMDEDGCPDVKPQKVVITKKQIEILEKVKFATGKATIDPASFGVLDEVAQVILDNPDSRVRVEGHTDNEGDDAFNLKLSQERADSVRAYLIEKGVAPERLDAKGYGETKPIDTNRTDAGRANNRRVEFHILKAGAE
ncbi:MAG: OmpA family protein [Alphaproteobacteria bacterium]|nr:OmpA family protein [Alphaproteobacteria bacterium]